MSCKECKSCKCFTLGSDAEFFLRDEGGNLKSAIGIIEGTKYEPQPLQSGAMLSHDNVSLEVAFKYFKKYKDFSNHVDETLEEVSKIIHPLVLDFSSSAIFPDSELKDERAWEFGCDPDFNAWTGNFNPKPKGRNKNLRTNGGHIHIGNRMLADPRNHLLFVKNLDLHIGLWSISHDTDTQRRQLYGKAGAFRPTEYGVEYRVLSNFWIPDKEHRFQIWKLVSDNILMLSIGRLGEVPEDIISIINGGC